MDKKCQIKNSKSAVSNSHLNLFTPVFTPCIRIFPLPGVREPYHVTLRYYIREVYPEHTSKSEVAKSCKQEIATWILQQLLHPDKKRFFEIIYFQKNHCVFGLNYSKPPHTGDITRVRKKTRGWQKISDQPIQILLRHALS